MKKLFIGLSLALNTGLVWLFIASSRETASPIAETAKPTLSRAGATSGESPSGLGPATKTDNLPDLIGRLRKEGFPTAFIRAVVGQRVHESFAARRQALDADLAHLPFWKTSFHEPERTLALKQLAKDEEHVMRDLLGPDGVGLDPVTAARDRREFGNLSPEKIELIRAARLASNQKRGRDFLDIIGGGGIGAINLRQNALNQDLENAIAEFVTPEELADYRLRNSPTTTSLQRTLAAFDATEEEYRTIFRLKDEYERNHPPTVLQPGENPAISARAQINARRTLDAQIAAALGADRGGEYLQKTDAQYLQAWQRNNSIGISTEAVDQLWPIQHDIQQRATMVRLDRSIDAGAKAQQLAALADEAKAKSTTILGEKGFEAYRQSSGNWIQALQSSPVRAGPNNPPAAR